MASGFSFRARSAEMSTLAAAPRAALALAAAAAPLTLLAGALGARRLAIALLVIFVIAAVITPTPDVATQTVFAVPMILLYLLGVFVAWLFGKRPDPEA